jgi:hypothetical protein
MKKSGWLYLVLFLATTVMYCCTKEEDTSGTNSDGVPPTALSVLEKEADYNFIISGATKIVMSGDNVTITGSGAVFQNKVIDITKSGFYTISGTLNDGQLRINTTDSLEAVKIQFDGVDISSSKGSAVFIKKAGRAIINLKSGSSNSIKDKAGYLETDGEQNAALFSQGFLAIYGDGVLAVAGNYKDAITSKDGLLIRNANISISSVDDGIRGKDFLVIRDSKIKVNTTSGDGLLSDLTQFPNFGYVEIIKSDVTVDAKGDGIFGETNVNITSGQFNIKAGGGSGQTTPTDKSAKGIKANKAITINSAIFDLNTSEDGIHSDDLATINASTIKISTADDGIRATNKLTMTDDNVTISKSYEGVEGFDLNFTRCNMNIVASNDAINATKGSRVHSSDGSIITITDGTYVLDGLSGDPLDSNGSIVMNNGTIIIHGPSKNPEVPIDYNGSFNMKKGTVVASANGLQMLQTPEGSGDVVTVKAVFSSNQAAGTVFNITDNAGKAITTFKPQRPFVAIIVSSEQLKAGTTYKISTGGTPSGTDTGGYFTGYTGGAVKSTVTLKSGVNTINL